ncbi:MAG: PrsW family glutamic-type intramembrane protease [Desulfomonilaceae bacterium]
MAVPEIRDIRSRKESQITAMFIELLYIMFGLAPGILWLFYFFIVSGNRPKSFESIFRVFLWAAMFTIPTALLEQALNATIIKPTMQESAMTSFLMIAPAEEFFKLLAVWIGGYRRSDFRSPIDGMTYSFTAALGFVVVENALYIVRMGPAVVWSRLLYATPAHILFSALWGYSLGIARFVPSGEIWLVARGFIASVLFHGGYNILVAVAPDKAKITLPPFLAVLLIIVIALIRKLLNASPYSDLGNTLLTICPNCEAFVPELSTKCPRCGISLYYQDIDSRPRFCWRCRRQVSLRSRRCPRCFVRLNPGSQADDPDFLNMREPQDL